MGFSVSGSFAILALATFVAVGTLYPTVAMGVDQISRAQSEADSDQLVQQNTDINITRAEWRTVFIENRITIEVENTGSTVLSLDETDVIVDNRHFQRDEFLNEEVIESDGSQNSDTDLWQPGETYRIEISATILIGKIDVPPRRTKIVTGPGVADTTEVE